MFSALKFSPLIAKYSFTSIYIRDLRSLSVYLFPPHTPPSPHHLTAWIYPVGEVCLPYFALQASLCCESCLEAQALPRKPSLISRWNLLDCCLALHSSPRIAQLTSHSVPCLASRVLPFYLYLISYFVLLYTLLSMPNLTSHLIA